MNGNGSISSRGRSPRDEDPLPFTQGMQFHCTPRAHVAKLLSHGLLYNGILGLKFTHKLALSMMFLLVIVPKSREIDDKISKYAKFLKKFVKSTEFEVQWFSSLGNFACIFNAP